ncbi:hypothetical protein V5N11_002752 [Cardamine amara subsp. amara]|uniref:Uncharacterized protein n=1 Tax=Cardamine amara subsp. amara TaxID=228776 RepID=A0ABD1C677_CARAN
MEFALDKALKEMSIYDEKPLVLNSNLKLSLHERITCILMGRLLNHENQKMADKILDIPHVWRLYSRVHVVALPNESFQFIFD